MWHIPPANKRQRLGPPPRPFLANQALVGGFSSSQSNNFPNGCVAHQQPFPMQNSGFTPPFQSTQVLVGGGGFSFAPNNNFASGFVAQQQPFPMQPFQNSQALVGGFSCVAQQQPLPVASQQLLHIFGFTPFGIFCHRCSCPLVSDRRAIVAHVKNYHAMDESALDYVDAFVSLATREAARLSRETNPADFIVSSVDGFLCSCGATFRKKKQSSPAP